MGDMPSAKSEAVETASGLVADARRCPIDFDHESPRHAANWPEEFREIREKCPVAWSSNHGGFWVAARYKDVIEIAQKPAAFTNGKSFNPETGEASGGLTIPVMPAPRGIPDETDSPEWDLFRSFLNRRLAPKAAEARRPMAEKLAAAVLNRVIETGRMDMVDDLTNPLPALVTMDFFGLPLHEWRQFADPLHKIQYIAKTLPEYPEAIAGMDWLMKRVREEAARKRHEPGDDLLTYLATGQVDGKLLDDDTIWQISFNLLTGGVDTTTGLTSHVLHYLNDRPEERRFLAENRDKWPVAREEFIRFFSPIHGLARNVSQPATINGQKMEPGERLYLAYSGANRDPEIFDDPDTIKLDRFPNRHVGFGAGQHRCLGSFLARMMFETMLDAVLTRIPDYRIDVDKAESYASIGVVNGWISLPATFTPGPKVAVDIEL